MTKKIKAGVFGATGYSGQQLISILLSHKEVEIDFISSSASVGKEFNDIYPQFRGIFSDKLISFDEGLERIQNVDVVFSALPSGAVFEIAKKALEKNKRLIDLSGDFRILEKETYEFWYKTEHKAGEILEHAVYGLPELFEKDIKEARLIANPGCYSTASILALAPLLRTDELVDPYSIIIDAKSGVTGAGRKEEMALLLAESSESIKAYSIATHRHIPEIEQELSIIYGERLNITFTPHLIPMKRGILATCYINAITFCSDNDIYEIYEKYYANSPFIRIRREPLETRFVTNTNFCDISIKVDIRSRRIIITSAIDNLIKGAAGQAVQNMNLMFGFDCGEGLSRLMPLIP